MDSINIKENDNSEKEIEVKKNSIIQEEGTDTKFSSTPQSNTSVLNEAEECIGQSLLIFLYADFRLMSATGRISTKYENLYIGSDLVPRTSAIKQAGLPDHAANENVLGISPAQLMAILLIELRKEIKMKQDQDRNYIDDDDNDDSLLSKLGDPGGRIGIDDSLSKLLRSYNSMIGRDLKEDIPKVTTKDLRAEALKQFPVRMDSFKIKFEKMVTRKKSIKNFRQNSVPSFTNLFDSEKSEQLNTPKNERSLKKSNTTNATTDYKTRRSITGWDIFNLNHNDVNYKNEKLQAQKVVHGFFQPSVTEHVSFSERDSGRMLSESELLEEMEKAVKSRVYNRMDFLQDFFKDDTISKVLAKSKARIVWMNDWYPLKDLTYAISVDKQKKIAMVVFRGAITKADWSHAFDNKLASVENPIKDGYDSRKKYLKIHRGFYRYLFRIRKDTGSTKYDEIVNKLHHLGTKIIGEDYKVFVTGHSLGAALSTVFAFFASCDERFTRNSYLKMITFGSPYVGGRAFADAFKYQEQANKMRYVRMYNKRDSITYLPPNMKPTKTGSMYQHVGVAVKLPVVNFLNRYACVNKRMKLFGYVPEEGFFKSYYRALKNNYILNLALPWKITESHTLDEMHERVLFWKAVRDKGHDPFLNRSIDDIYDHIVFKTYV